MSSETINRVIARGLKRRRAEVLPHLVNATEIARRAGVGRPAVANWSARGVGFPEPVVRLMYDWREVEEWLRTTGRYPKPSSPTIARPVDDWRFPRRAWRP